MSPTHTTKGNRRYRYYISQAVLQFRESQAGSVIRTPARPLEEAITGKISQLLGNSHNLLDILSPASFSAPLQKSLITNAKTLADDWEGIQTVN